MPFTPPFRVVVCRASRFGICLMHDVMEYVGETLTRALDHFNRRGDAQLPLYPSNYLVVSLPRVFLLGGRNVGGTRETTQRHFFWIAFRDFKSA